MVKVIEKGLPWRGIKSPVIIPDSDDIEEIFEAVERLLKKHNEVYFIIEEYIGGDWSGVVFTKENGSLTVTVRMASLSFINAYEIPPGYEVVLERVELGDIGPVREVVLEGVYNGDAECYYTVATGWFKADDLKDARLKLDKAIQLLTQIAEDRMDDVVIVRKSTERSLEA